ncbi:hypothetical protein SISSUDRAFT_1046993, partial [Sistotremastrum suecicum HHB10207 ss-3]
MLPVARRLLEAQIDFFSKTQNLRLRRLFNQSPGRLQFFYDAMKIVAVSFGATDRPLGLTLPRSVELRLLDLQRLAGCADLGIESQRRRSLLFKARSVQAFLHLRLWQNQRSRSYYPKEEGVNFRSYRTAVRRLIGYRGIELKQECLHGGQGCYL